MQKPHLQGCNFCTIDLQIPSLAQEGGGGICIDKCIKVSFSNENDIELLDHTLAGADYIESEEASLQPGFH